MELADEARRENRIMQRAEEDLQYEASVRRRGLSEPKPRTNLIKINKNKLPVDFFPKRAHSNSRRPPPLRFNLPSEMPDPPLLSKKAESERLHYSPQKTSFFACFDDEPASAGRIGGRVYNRKFETRDQPKRDAFAVESARKLTTATKQCKNEFLELFPSTHDEMTTEIIISSSKTRNFKLSPRKEYTSKARDLQVIVDPQKQHSAALNSQFEIKYRQVECTRPPNFNTNTMGKESDSLNITFFNAKSSCFPPINRHS